MVCFCVCVMYCNTAEAVKVVQHQSHGGSRRSIPDRNRTPSVAFFFFRCSVCVCACRIPPRRSPGFLTLSVSDNLEPKLWWLRDKLDVSLADAAKILTTYPNIFSLSIEANLEPKLW